MLVGIISDTHGELDPRAVEYFADCDEVWHAGDFGSIQVADKIEENKLLRGVYGNIDDRVIRNRYPEDLWFECMGVEIWMTHIAGHPGRYDRRVKRVLKERQPQLLICGHSHILRLDHDAKHGGMLCLNPGAAGHQGFHLIRTIILAKFCPSGIENLKIIELGSRGNRDRSQEKVVDIGTWAVPRLDREE